MFDFYQAMCGIILFFICVKSNNTFLLSVYLIVSKKQIHLIHYLQDGQVLTDSAKVKMFFIEKFFYFIEKFDCKNVLEYIESHSIMLLPESLK